MVGNEINAGVYEALVQSQPALARTVQELITLGETPQQIEWFLVSKFGHRPLVAFAVAAAEYLYNQVPRAER